MCSVTNKSLVQPHPRGGDDFCEHRRWGHWGPEKATYQRGHATCPRSVAGTPSSLLQEVKPGLGWAAPSRSRGHPPTPSPTILCFFLSRKPASVPCPAQGAAHGTSTCYLSCRNVSFQTRLGGPQMGSWLGNWPSRTLVGLWVTFPLTSEQRHHVPEPCKMISLSDFLVSHSKSWTSLACNWLSGDLL